MLTTMSGYGRSASIVATTNSQDYLKDIQTLLSSVDMLKPEAASAPPAAAQNAPGPRYGLSSASASS